MYALTLCDFRVDYELTVTSPLLVGAGKEREFKQLHGSRRKGEGKARGEDYELQLGPGDREGGGDGDVTLPIHEVLDSGAMQCFIPGTSMRGALRHGLWRRFDHALASRTIDPQYTRDVGRTRKGGEIYGDPATAVYWTPRFGNVLLRQLFGSEARRGALEFSRLDTNRRPSSAFTWYSRTRKEMGRHANVNLRFLTHNRLDRFTMASTSGLRNSAAVEVGSVFKGFVSIVNFAWWQVGALGVAFDAIDRGEIRLGKRGATGQGTGKVKPVRIVVRYHRAVAPVEGQPLPGVGALKCERLNGKDQKQIFGIDDAEPTQTVRMFLRDRHDHLPAGAPAAGDIGKDPDWARWSSHGWLDWAEHRVWQGENDCDRILKLATARLAAMAESISEPLVPIASSPTPITGAAANG